jgi:hypothetical protein
MIINITELFTVKRKSINPILHWLDQHVGAYIGPGTGFCDNLYVDGHRDSVLHIGRGWQINAVDYVDSYGHTMIYELDITDDRLATFFILKFL